MVTPGAGTYTFDAGTRVNVAAAPSADWAFSHWTGAVADAKAAATSVVVNSNVTVTAHFIETPLVISDVQAIEITRTGAVITWKTNRDATGTVEYSPGNLTAIALTSAASQQVILSGLQPVTVYIFKVRAKDASGNEAVSTEYSFTTTGTAAAFVLDGSFDVADLGDGKKVTFTGTVTNTGDLAGTFNAELLVNAAVEGTAAIELGPGAAKPLSFSATRTTAGSYSARVAEFNKDFTIAAPVVAAATLAAGTGGYNLPLLALLILMAVFILWFFLRRRKKSQPVAAEVRGE